MVHCLLCHLLYEHIPPGTSLYMLPKWGFVHDWSPAACKDTKADVQREMDILHILKQGNCDNVVRMFDFGWDSTGTLATIVMEFVMYGSLLEYLQWSGRKMQASHSMLPCLSACTCATVLQEPLQQSSLSPGFLIWWLV